MRFQQLKRDPNSVMRKKLVKSKKAWVVVSSLSIAGGLLMMTAPSYVAKAEVTTAAPTTQTETTPSSTGTTSSDSSTTVSTTSAPTTNTTDSGSKTAANSTTPVDNNTGDKDTEVTTKTSADTTAKADDTTSATKEVTTVENTPVSGTSETPATTNTTTPTIKAAAYLAATPTDATDEVTPVTDDSVAKTPVVTPADAASSDTDATKDTTTTVDTSSLATYNLMTVAPTAATLSADALAAEAVVAPVTPVAEATAVTTNTGNGWNYDSTNTTLNITGQLDEGDGTDKDRWGGNTSAVTTINIAPSTGTTITAPQNSSYLFANMTNLATINGLDKFDTSNTSNMQGMFKNDSTITNIDLSSNVLNAATDISHMFENDSKLGNVDIASGVTSTDPRPGKPFKKLTDSSYAFANDVELTNVDSLKSWQGWYLSNLSGMFKNDAKITSLNLSNLMWTTMGTKPNTGDSSVGAGMFDGTNLQSITLSPALSFSPNTALTSTSGGQWVSNVGDISGKSFNFLGVPSINATGTATGGIGALYTGAKVSGDTTLTYNATKLATGTTVSNLITINTNHGPISFIDQGTVGQTSTINVPDTFKFEDGNTYTRTSDPTVQVTFDQTQATAPGEATYVGALISNGTATISSNDGDKTVTDITGHVGDTVDVTVPTKTGYTPDKTTVSGVIQPDGSVKVDDTVTYTGNDTTAPVTISTNKGDVTVSGVNGKVGDTVTVDVPAKTGYTSDKSTVQATINPDGSITTSDKVTYTGNPITNGKATISSNLGDQEVDNIAGNVDGTVTVTVPSKDGYTPDKTTVSGVIQPDGSVKVDEEVTYTGNPIADGKATISTSDGDKVVDGLSGKVGDTVTVDVPAKTGYTPDKTTVSGVIQPDGSVKVDEKVTYTGNDTTAPVTISTNKGDVTVSGVNGKVGDTVTVDVPAKTGYTPDKSTVQATINPDGSITTSDKVTYTGNDTTAPITISTNQGDVTVSGVNGKVGDTVTVDVPAKTGYTSDKSTVQATINPDGSITTSDKVTYTGNDTTAPVTISTNQGDVTVSGVNGKVGDTVTVDVPAKTGYTSDKSTVQATINPDGSITTTDKVTYTGDPIADGKATISTSDGDKVVDGLSGKVGDTVTVDVPAKTGYTPNKTTVSGVIQPDGSVKVDEKVTYTGNDTTAPVTISTNKGDVTVSGVNGKVGNTVTVDVPAKTGYTPNKTTVQATINPDGSITTSDKVTYTGNPITTGKATISSNLGDQEVDNIAGNVDGTVTVTVPSKDGYTPDKTTVSGVIQPDGSVKVDEEVTYTGNPIADGKATISTSDGDKVVDGLSGKVGDTVTVDVPAKTGYTPNKTTVSGVIQPDGSVKVDEKVTYTGNDTTAPVTISTNQGDVTVSGVNGKVGDTVTVDVPAKTGYTPDKNTVQATINPDGSITTTDKVTYTGNPITDGKATVSTSDGDKVVDGLSGKVGDTVTVDVPAKTGYTPDKSTVSGVIQPDGSVKVDEKVTYTGNDTTAPVTISTNQGDVTVSGVNGKVGDTVTVDVPAKTGYTPDKNTVQATINPDGSITTSDKVTYTGNDTTAPVTISTNQGDVTVSGVNGKVGDTVTVDVPAKTGYTSDKSTVQATINPDGSITTTDKVTYTGNDTTAPVTISTNQGNVTVSGVNGKVGDTVTVDVPAKTGYTPDKSTVQATINPDGSITTTDKVTYTGNPITDGKATVSTNDGDKPVDGIKGKVGDTVAVTVPSKDGYTPNKTTVPGVIQPDGSVKVDEKVTYTGNDTTAPVTISTNKGDVTVSGVNGKVGDTVTVDVPAKTGYISDKSTVQATINPDGSITTTEDVTYTGNATTAPVTISTNKGDVTVSDVNGKVGDTVTVDVPAKTGYTPDKSTVQATINPDGSITPNETVTYTGVTNLAQKLTLKNPDGTTSDFTIPEGKYGDAPQTITATAISGYSAPAVIVTYNADGTSTITDANDPKKALTTDDVLSYTRKSSGGSSTVTRPGEGVIEQKAQTISTYSDKPDVELYQIGSDNKMSQITNRVLVPASNWYSDATVTIDGVSYYRVATNEWAKMSQAYPYQALNLHIRTYNDSEKALYKAENIVISNETLAPSSSWITDRETYVINNTKYYRVATNEFVSADDVYVYSPVNMVVTTHANQYTTVYDAKGVAVTNRSLNSDSSWKADSIAYINGDKYYRVATNEFVKASDVDINTLR